MTAATQNAEKTRPEHTGLAKLTPRKDGDLSPSPASPGYFVKRKGR